MTITNFRWLLLLPALALNLGHASAACSNETLHGSYVFHISGQILAPAAVAGLVSGVALTEFYGDGDLTQVDHVVHNGVTPKEDWRPGSGKYSINSDCTGVMTIKPEPKDPADGGPELQLYIIVSENGDEIQTVVSGACSPQSPSTAACSTTVAGFEANITSTGRRQRDW